MPGRFIIQRVTIRNFRSILDSTSCISEPLTYIVGPNGSGKTNFFSALSFVRKGLRESLDKAVKDIGGAANIVPAPARWPSTTELQLQWHTSGASRGCYTIELRFESARDYSVVREECEIQDSDSRTSHFIARMGQASGTPEILPAGSPDRLYLVQASGLPEFREAYESLSSLHLSEPVPPALLTPALGKRADFEGFANRVIRLKESHPDRLHIVEEYLRAVLPTFANFDIGVTTGDLPYLKFMEKTHAGRPIGFSIKHMSAGSVYLADLLIDLFSPPESSGAYLPWMIEEPETGLHPGAIRVLRDAFLEASQFRQLIITTHSPEFLDDNRLSDQNMLAAYRDANGSHISNLDQGTRRILRESLYTVGELLRQGLLEAPEIPSVADSR
jgi:predicted ATPase